MPSLQGLNFKVNKKKIKIAFVTPIYLPTKLSGSGTVVRDLTEELARMGNDVSVITSNALTARYWYDPIFGKRINKEFEVINRVKIYRLKCNQILSSTLFILVRKFSWLVPVKNLNKLIIQYNGPHLRNIDKLLNQKKFDVIHCSPFPLNINRQIVEKIKKLKKRPKLIFTPLLHTELKDFKNPEFKKVLSKADLVHVVTNSEKLFLKKNFNVEDNKIVYVPLFLDLKRLTDLGKLEKQVKRFKNKYKLNNKKIVFFAGNKGYMKGVITLLRAIDKLHREDMSYFFIVVGNNMPEWIKEKNKTNAKFLLDFDYVDDKTKEIIFAACDIYCMPSKSESFGLTYLEAWQKKKPVIGCDIPAVKELINNVSGGLLVQYGNENNLINAIKMLADNPILARKLGINGYKEILLNYNLDKLINKYTKLLNIN